MYRQPQRIEYLDSIRGLAALAVLLGHSFIFQWPLNVSGFINLPIVNIGFNGKEAVAMFFVLSGFVLSRPYFASSPTPARKMFVPTFYLRRFTRIWLPWLAAFGLSALAQYFLFHPWPTKPPTNDWFGWFWHVPPTFMSFLRQCLFIEHDATVQLLNQDWSLGVELKGSLLMPVFIFLSGGWRLAGLLATATALFWVLPNGGAYYSLFIMGMLLARYGDSVVERLKSRPLAIKLGLLLAGALLYGGLQYGNRFHPNHVKCFWLMTGVGCILILLATMSSRRIQLVLQLQPITFLGRISYSVYLLQFIVILCVLPAWVHLLNNIGMQRTCWLLPLTLAASVGVTVGLSAATYRLIEMPCIELGHWSSKTLQARLLKK